jgi:selenocysteine lyase/cysteine desulfurase
MGAHAMMDVGALRAQTPGCAHRIHLNNAGAALLAQPTLDAMIGQLRLEAEIGGYEAADQAREGIAAVYAAIAELVGGRSEEVALFDNATHAWNAAFYSVPLGRGDRILTGRAEYGSNVLAYWQAAERTGAEVVVVPNDRYGQLDVAALAAMADERTRLIGVSHVPTSGGLVQPVAEIGKIARACGALFLLDATQSVGQLPLDAAAIGCDMLTGTGRKFLRGPRGTGFLWVRTAALERLDPFVAEIGSATWDGHGRFTWAQGARRFGTWEHSYVNVLGLGAAVRQALDLGLPAIARRAVALGTRLRDQLGELPSVSTHDLGQTRCAIVTAKVSNRAAGEVAAALRRAGLNVSTTVPEHNPLDTQDRAVHPLIRFSPHYYNTEDEIDRATELLAGQAR